MYQADRGFGFIRVDGEPESYFFHITKVLKGVPQQGEHVTFDLVEAKGVNARSTSRSWAPRMAPRRATARPSWRRHSDVRKLRRDRLELRGERFGRLRVFDEADPRRCRSGHVKRRWHCECSCGQVVVVLQSHLRAGWTRSCGCLTRDQQREVLKAGRAVMFPR